MQRQSGILFQPGPYDAGDDDGDFPGSRATRDLRCENLDTHRNGRYVFHLPLKRVFAATILPPSVCSSCPFMENESPPAGKTQQREPRKVDRYVPSGYSGRKFEPSFIRSSPPCDPVGEETAALIYSRSRNRNTPVLAGEYDDNPIDGLPGHG